jgi:thiamine biosynthesis lipoprotein
VTPAAPEEAQEHFPCFGGECAVLVMGDAPGVRARQAAERARALLLAWHDRFSRFEPDSELSRMNADPEPAVLVSSLMARLVEAVVWVARLTGGLVDATLVDEIERAGYAGHFEGAALPLREALRIAPRREPGRPREGSRWQEIEVDRATATVRRPPGVRIDSGGIAKGLFADVLGGMLTSHLSFAVDCSGDLRLGGSGALPRTVEVLSPFEPTVLHRFERTGGGVATSGIGRRSWLDAGGRPAHHLLNPATGRPAYTGVVQVTALAPSSLEAEARTKAALLSGPRTAAEWLPHGGIIVFDDGSHRVLEPPRAVDFGGGVRVTLPRR